MNYRVIGALNRIFGILQVIFSLYMISFVSPKIFAFFSESGLEMPILYFAKYEILGLILLTGIIGTVLGLWTLFKSKENFNKISFVFLAFSVGSLIYIIYSVVSFAKIIYKFLEMDPFGPLFH
mgnify:CR=1 FL=1